MNMEEEMSKLYRKIAEIVNEMIPEDWEKFYYYAQVSDDGGGTYFYYNTPDNIQNYKYSLEIPFKHEIDSDKFNEYEMQLFELSEKLRNVFIENDQEPWYSFTMSLERTGKFKMHYDYTDWLNTNYSFSDQLIIWRYKYLGDMPNDTKLQALIDKYLTEYPENPI